MIDPVSISVIVPHAKPTLGVGVVPGIDVKAALLADLRDVQRLQAQACIGVERARAHTAIVGGDSARSTLLLGAVADVQRAFELLSSLQNRMADALAHARAGGGVSATKG